MIKDFRVSPNFKFSEAVHTSQPGLLEKNWETGLVMLPAIVLTANMMEGIRHYVLGDDSCKVNSLLRCPAVNGATAGAWSRSQHLKAEACDWRPWRFRDRETIHLAYKLTIEYLISERVMFGQLIFEGMTHDDGSTSYWIHLSRGAPFRPIERCGEILEKPPDGPYTMVRKVAIYDLWINI